MKIEDVIKIRESKASDRELAKIYDVRAETIANIRMGNTWKNVGGPLRENTRKPGQLTGEQVKFIRAKLGLSQRALANILGLRSDATISHIEHGQKRITKVKQDKLRDYYNNAMRRGPEYLDNLRRQGEQNGRCKLTDEEVRAIRESTLPNVDMSLKYNVSSSHVSRLRTGHVRPEAGGPIRTPRAINKVRKVEYER